MTAAERQRRRRMSRRHPGKAFGCRNFALQPTCAPAMDTGQLRSDHSENNASPRVRAKGLYAAEVRNVSRPGSQSQRLLTAHAVGSIRTATAWYPDFSDELIDGHHAG